MQYSWFHFVAIISANTKSNFLHSQPIPPFPENTNGHKILLLHVHYSVVIFSLLLSLIQSITLLNTWSSYLVALE